EPYLKASQLRAPDDTEGEAATREEAAELAGIFQALMRDLDPIDRAILDRFYFRGQSRETIQSDLGMSRGAFRMRAARLRGQLRIAYRRIERLAPGSPDGGQAA